MLKPKKLRIRGVGRFVDQQVIDFESMGSFVQVDGNNRNTGGSSGSAKTTIFNAFDYLLGFSDVPATILQSRLTKEGMLVECDFDWDGKDLTISRGKKEGLKITVDGNLKSGSIKLVEEELDKILAMPRELFRQMLHKRQFSRGFFLSMTPKEVYEFLTSCLNLESEKAKVDVLDKKIKGLAEQNDFINKALEVQKQGKSATEDAMLSLGVGPVKDMHEEVIASLKEKVVLSHQNFVMTAQRHKIELQTIQNTRPSYKSTPYVTESFTQVVYDRTTLSKCEEGMKLLNNRLAAANKAESDRQVSIMRQISDQKLLLAAHQKTIADSDRARSEATAKAIQVKSIQDSLCPTCEQTWADQKAKDKQDKLMQEILALKQTVMSGIEATQLAEEVKKTVLELTSQAMPQKSQELLDVEVAQARLNQMISNEKAKENEHSTTQRQLKSDHDLVQNYKSKEHNNFEAIKNQTVMAEYNQKEESLRAQQAAEAQQVSGQLDIDHRAHVAAEDKLKAYQTAKASYDASVARMKSQYDTYVKAVDALDNELTKTTSELLLAEEAKRAVKSYISRSFDDALETISEMTTRIIRSVPIMANATVQLESTRETKEGRVKEEVNAVVNMDGEEAVPLKSLCGGEGSSLHLAVDLAVIDLIEQRTAKGISIFILDEPFTGMDTVCIEMALEVLKNSNTNKKIIIVDHNPEIKQMVQTRIVVERIGSTSRILT